MQSLRKTIASLVRHRGRWEKLMQGAHRARHRASDAVASRLEEVRGFGSNPGNLRMFRYLPSRLAANPALVVVLHGCTQTAAGYDRGRRLVDACRPLRLCPAPARAAAIQQSQGLLQLVPDRRHRAGPRGSVIDPADGRENGDRQRHRSVPRVHHRPVGGRSDDIRHACLLPGGLRRRRDHCRPAIRRRHECAAGVREHVSKPGPLGAANGAISCVAASPHNGPWPRISVWHGGADKTVIPANAR